jgi:hypothetical protein
MISRLLAKSWDYPDIAKPESVFLDRHLRDVVLCASSIASTTEDYQLGCFGLDPNIYRERFRKILLVSAACHDLGLKQAIAYLSESDFRSAAATEPAGLV